MDIVLEICDTFFFDRLYSAILPLPAQAAALTSSNYHANLTGADPLSIWTYKPASKHLSFVPSDAAYQSLWARDNIYREATSIFLITWIFGMIMYFIFATLSYIFIFDKTTFQHPKFLKQQVRQEIAQASIALPAMAVLTLPIFLLEIHGYSKIYDSSSDGPGLWYDYAQIPLLLFFTDCCIYFIHRGLHHPAVYKKLHKAHHKWIVPTPFASYAFHPVDGFAQGLPYHIFPFLFPLQKSAYLALFALVALWTVLIHDGEYATNSPVINGAACHTMHHLYFNYNYGQYTTLWDRLGGTYRIPNAELFTRESKMGQKEWKRQVLESEKMVNEVEDHDDRTYVADPIKKDN